MKPFESWKVRVLAGVAVATVLAATVGALGTGQSFSPATLEAPYQQELYAVTDLGTSPIDDVPIIFGGVAFAPNGDPWVSDCVFENSTLHRFAKDAVLPPINLTSTLHPEAMTVPTAGRLRPDEQSGRVPVLQLAERGRQAEREHGCGRGHGDGAAWQLARHHERSENRPRDLRGRDLSSELARPPPTRGPRCGGSMNPQRIQ